MAVTRQQWEGFELLVAQIETEAAPTATVQHNIKLPGKSGVPRQIDVAVQQVVGLHKVLIVIECKHHRQAVDINTVGEFASKLEDVRASEGVLVSPVGYTSGAKDLARDRGIWLRTLKEAVEEDWKAIVAAENWFRFYLVRRVPREAELIFTDQGTGLIGLDELLWYADGSVAGPVRNVFLGMDRDLGGPSTPGPFELELRPDPSELANEPSVMAAHEGALRPVLGAIFRGEALPTEYIASAVLSGHVVRDEISGQRVFESYQSSGVDWQEMIQRQEGRQLSVAEWRACVEDNKVSVLRLAEMPKRFIRLVVSRRGEGSA